MLNFSLGVPILTYFIVDFKLTTNTVLHFKGSYLSCKVWFEDYELKYSFPANFVVSNFKVHWPNSQCWHTHRSTTSWSTSESSFFAQRYSLATSDLASVTRPHLPPKLRPYGLARFATVTANLNFQSRPHEYQQESQWSLECVTLLLRTRAWRCRDDKWLHSES